MLARSRLMLVLSVLSGEKTVSEASRSAGISRESYYEMQRRALEAMLAALNPLAPAKGGLWVELSAAADRIYELQMQLKRLEQAKRRSQRLLVLTRKSIEGPLRKARRGRRPKDAFLVSIASGNTEPRKTAAPALDSMPTKPGANDR